ncbi:MAG: DUF1800 domain-containing protein [Pseudoxanthomonas sp.]
MNTDAGRHPASAAVALNRFGLGARRGEAPPQDPAGWLLRQFGQYTPLPAAWQASPDTAQALIQARQMQAGRKGDEAARMAARKQMRQEIRDDYAVAVHARVTSALESPAPFVERLVHFWANHFAISAEKPAVAALAGAFERDAIRPHVLGRFEDLLLAAERHPAMLLYLDQARSVGPDSIGAQRAMQRRPRQRRGLNENLAREILELHTLGARSGYDQQDVTEFARALTGWGVANPDAPRGRRDGTGDASGFAFHPQLHQPGARTLLDRQYPQAGEAQALAILHDLATAEATARHIATKLARHFVADAPPQALTERLAQAFLRSGGDLPVVYRTLVESPESWDAQAAKFKTPWEWTVSALRGTGLSEPPALHPDRLLAQLGQPVWRPGSPAGYDDVAASWAAPDALMRRAEAAQRIAAAPGNGIDARELAPVLLPGVLSAATAGEIARAESPRSALALLLMAPEFMRR